MPAVHVPVNANTASAAAEIAAVDIHRVGRRRHMGRSC
jgi:hypothetical protein